jgi:TRAP-type C4-dicarboxylate transport system substrate-binding protein
MHRVVMAVALATVVLAMAGCGGSGSDKVGNVRRATTVLTMANSLGETNELQAFADEVAKRSDGAIRIRFINQWREGEPDYEPALIGDVAAGKADLGWAGSRAWPALGIHSFDALGAPFVVDSYELERDVLQSDIPTEMLGGIASAGVVGLGVLPGPLRYLLAAPRPLLSPDDFAGLRIGHQRGPARDTLLALGAKPVVIASAAPWRGIDAIEQQVESINGNRYDQSAKYLTANVALWPRPFVVFASSRTMARLTSPQRSLLRGALRAAIPDALRITQEQERDAMAALCRRGIDPVQASDDDRAALRDAVARVLDRLRRDPHTRAALDAIEALRGRQETAGEPPLACQDQAAPSAVGISDGSYTTTITRDDVRRSGVPPENVDFVGPRQHFELVFKSGSFILYETRPGGQRVVGLEGTYSVYRDHIVITATDGDEIRARWSVDGTQLTFTDVTPKHTPESLTWGSQPWTRRSP